MTKGSPMKLILSFTIPIIFGNLFQQLYNIVDTVVVGRFVGVDALAAVGSTGAVNFLVIGFVIGCCSGFSIKIAQCFGAGDLTELRKYLINAIYLSAGITVLITAITVIFCRPLLVLMQTPDSIIDAAYDYIVVIFIGIFSIMLYNFLSAVLRALGDSKTPLFFLFISSILNIILDLVFVLLFNMGVSGVAWATVISQGISGALCLVFIINKYQILWIQKDETAFNIKRCGTLLAHGLPMAFQFSITAIGSIIMQSAVNTLGAATIAAVTTANKVQMILIQPLETLGITAATFGGQNLGANKIDRISQGTKNCIFVSMVWCVIAFVIAWFGGEYIALMFIDSSEVEIFRLVKEFLRICAFFYPFLGVLFILRNLLQGLGYGILPMMAGVIELIARAAVAFLLVNALGYLAICLSSPIAWVAADVLLIAVYIVQMKKLKKKWLLGKEIEHKL